MQIDVPSGGNRAVWEGLLRGDVIARQQHIAGELTGLARAADVGDPLEFGVRMLVFSAFVLHGIESAKYRAQVPIAHVLQAIDRIFIEAALPEPSGVESLWIREILHVQI